MADDPRSTSGETLDATLGEAGEFGLIAELVKIFEGSVDFVRRHAPAVTG